MPPCHARRSLSIAHPTAVRNSQSASDDRVETWLGPTLLGLRAGAVTLSFIHVGSCPPPLAGAGSSGWPASRSSCSSGIGSRLFCVPGICRLQPTNTASECRHIDKTECSAGLGYGCARGAVVYRVCDRAPRGHRHRVVHLRQQIGTHALSLPRRPDPSAVAFVKTARGICAPGCGRRACRGSPAGRSGRSGSRPCPDPQQRA